MSAHVHPLLLPGVPATAGEGSMSTEHTEGLSSSADKFPLLIWQAWVTEDPAALCGSLSYRSQGAIGALPGGEIQESFEGGLVWLWEVQSCLSCKRFPSCGNALAANMPARLIVKIAF